MLLRVVAAVGICGVLATSAVAQNRKFSLQRVAFPKEQVGGESRVHPVNVFGSPSKELVVVEGAKVSIYEMEKGEYRLAQEMTLPSVAAEEGKLYYGFARLTHNGPHSMVLMSPTGISFYPTDGKRLAAEPAALLEGESVRGAAAGAAVQYFEFAMDFDNDGLDELLIPQPQTFAIYRQGEPMRFTRVKLPRNPYSVKNDFDLRQVIPPDATRANAASGSLMYTKGVENLLLFDADGDKRLDLIFWKTLPGPQSREVERYEVFRQRGGFTFPDSPDQTIEIPYEPNADVTFRDLNRDGLLDAILIQSNLDFVTPRTLVKFFIAGRGKEQLMSRETERFVSKDPVGIVRVDDFNGDGYEDFALTYFSYQFGSAEDIVDLVLGNKMRFRLQFYLAGGTKGFTRAPDHEKELQITMKPESYSGYQPLYIVPDMNGDGIMDLVVRADEGKLEVFPTSGAVDYRRQPAADLSVAGDAQVDFEDLNADGLMDMIVSSREKQSLAVYLSVAE